MTVLLISNVACAAAYAALAAIVVLKRIPKSGWLLAACTASVVSAILAAWGAAEPSDRAADWLASIGVVAEVVRGLSWLFVLLWLIRSASLVEPRSLAWRGVVPGVLAIGAITLSGDLWTLS